ncbi:hypothetical protein SAY87_004085 [Trapa incisa]|uniref:Uncharacterized protein n=1 Tax=Trapa incisa TaxID=236973 RepID=A0AAN7PLJ0_9MYRT|nr:hypothetical protein SAY87_004085 [Trapa incisa]
MRGFPDLTCGRRRIDFSELGLQIRKVYLHRFRELEAERMARDRDGGGGGVEGESLGVDGGAVPYGMMVMMGQPQRHQHQGHVYGSGGFHH